LKQPLSALEARVLGVLVEKQATVPDSYPLSLNALTLGCNQKTARDPVMNASEAEVLAAIEGLRERALINEVSGARVLRYEHNAPRGLGVPGQAAALLALLMLRGPQTAAELRANCERLHRFADTSSVEGFLDELAAKTPPLVVRLARAGSGREARWAHALGDVAPAPVAPADAPPPPPPPPGPAPAAAAALRFDLPAHKRLVFEMTMPIRWGDMDAMGHVNNTVYFRYLEIIRIAWCDSIGCRPDPQGEGPVIVNAFCNFHRQLEYPGELLARKFVGAVGRASVDTDVKRERTDQPGFVYASGGAKTVWTDFRAQQSRPIPDWLRKILVG
jgi:uncharacterized protein YceH (UPF0502 family)/acyl-CoA thioesterase FadM